MTASVTVPESFGRYEVIRKIGAGGMGVVLRARDPKLRRDVAIKVLPPQVRNLPTVAERFHREATILGKLSHPNIVQVFDAGEEGELLYYVMELLDGATLDSRTMEPDPFGRWPESPEFDTEEFLALFTPLAGALVEVHAAGVIHRDIKPANIFMEVAERGAVLTDFGLTTGEEGEGLTQEGTVLGTSRYMAPEQARGEAATDLSDLYSLGATMFEFATGRFPFFDLSGSNLIMARSMARLTPVRDLAVTVPEPIAALIDRAAALDPKDRFESARQLKFALSRAGKRHSSASFQAGAEALSTGSRSTPAMGLPSPSSSPSLPGSTMGDQDGATGKNGLRKWAALAAVAFIGVSGYYAASLWQRESRDASIRPGKTADAAVSTSRTSAADPPKDPFLALPRTLETREVPSPEHPLRLSTKGKTTHRLGMAVMGDQILAAWYVKKQGVEFRLSRDEGKSWRQPESRNTPEAHLDSHLPVAALGDRYHMVFTAKGPDGKSWVQATSTDSLVSSWDKPQLLGPVDSYQSPLLLIDGGGRSSRNLLLAIWKSDEERAPVVAWHVDGTWTVPSVLPGQVNTVGRYAGVLSREGVATLIWQSRDRSVDSKLLVMSRSMGPGRGWSKPAPVGLETEGFDQVNPSLAMSGSYLLMQWSEKQYPMYPLLLGVSFDGGKSFKNTGRYWPGLNKDNCSLLAIHGNHAWAVSNGLDPHWIGWARSRDGGRSWSKPKNLSAVGDKVMLHQIRAVDPGHAWLLWRDDKKQVKIARLP